MATPDQKEPPRAPLPPAPPQGASARDIPLHGTSALAKESALKPVSSKSIHLADVHELRYWTQTLGVSSDALVGAVRAVGHDVNKVVEYLRKGPSASH